MIFSCKPCAKQCALMLCNVQRTYSGQGSSKSQKAPVDSGFETQVTILKARLPRSLGFCPGTFRIDKISFSEEKQ